MAIGPVQFVGAASRVSALSPPRSAKTWSGDKAWFAKKEGPESGRGSQTRGPLGVVLGRRKIVKPIRVRLLRGGVLASFFGR